MRKNNQMSKMESLSIHSHDTSLQFTHLAKDKGWGQNEGKIDFKGPIKGLPLVSHYQNNLKIRNI